MRDEEIAEKFNIDLRKLRLEQLKLAKQVKIEDSFDFSNVQLVGAIENIFFKNHIISACVVVDAGTGEVVQQDYSEEKVKFPYIPGFRAYRELPAMLDCFNKLEEKPDVVFIPGHGILHPRLGLASHFSLAAEVPAIGVAKSLFVGKVKDDNVSLDGKIKGKVVKLKRGANPVYVSPGDKISLETSVELVKKFTREGRKLPEPLRLAHKYAREIRKEIFGE